jgi:hypothetical protein
MLWYPGPGRGFERLLVLHLLHGAVVLFLVLGHEHLQRSAGLLLLFVEVVDDDSDEQVQSEERAEDDEEHKVEVHVDVDLSLRLVVHLSMVKDSLSRRRDPRVPVIQTSLESVTSFMI